MTHTPGPWHVDSTHVRHAINTSNVHIAMANIGPRLTEEESIANARLIAAAPELLDALKAALDSIGNDPDIYWKGDLMGLLEEAIAKAEGE